LSRANAAHQAKSDALPYAVAKKIFVFGHSFTDGAHDLSKLNSGPDLVVFPPEGDLDTGMSMVRG
jgi:hypothetical protein